MNIGEFRLEATDGNARAGTLQTAHGPVETPVFMPVGTKASVKSVDPDTLKTLGAQVVLGNTYHLYLAPGDERVKRLGGLHQFMHWDGPILTDSGGFQVFSLGAGKQRITNHQPSLDELRPAGELRITEDEKPEFIPEAKVTEGGVEFRSHKDGSKHFFTPEKSIDIQAHLGADIIMAFDECPPYPSTKEYYKASMERTHRWLDRSIERKKELKQDSQLLFGIIQGGIIKEYREQSATFVVSKNLPGLAIGGIANGGEDKALQIEQVGWVVPHLPHHKPRYLMGIGTPYDLVQFVALGIDMFDCVLPTRLARNGAVWIVEDSKGMRAQLKNARFTEDKCPVMEGCLCSTCTRFSRAYVHHLFMENEPLGMQLASIHNLHMLLDQSQRMRKAILEHRFEQFAETQRSIWQSST